MNDNLAASSGAFIKNARDAITIAGFPFNSHTICAFVKTVPRQPTDLLHTEWEDGFCCRTLRAAAERNAESPDYRRVVEYWLAQFVARPRESQTVLIYCALGFFAEIQPNPEV